MFEFDEKRPEECGIPKAAIEELQSRMERLGLKIHGYLLLSGKSIIGEHYWEPYGRDVNHRMYSITKSFVALAAGLLAAEGKISLEDRICDYFPEKLPKEGAHPWCLEMTIRDMLTMRTCYASTTYKRYQGDWVESFFRVEPDHVPGTVFAYDTSASHVLAALVEKLTGKKLLHYLREKVFDRLGFSDEAYIMEDSAGVSQGGSGLCCTLRDMARVAWLCCNGGVLEGEELIPGAFLKEATACQVPTDMQSALDEQQGYGYMIWKPREKGFVFYGMGGQLALCFPELDCCYLTMADTIGNPAGLQMLYDSFYDTVYPYFAKRAGKDICAAQKSQEGAQTAADCAADLPAGGTYCFYSNPMQWEKVSFDWEQGSLLFTAAGRELSFVFQAGKTLYGRFPGTDYTCQCSALWKMGHFILHCYVTDEEQGHVSMDFAWKDKRLSLRMTSTSEEYFVGLKGIASAVYSCS